MVLPFQTNLPKKFIKKKWFSLLNLSLSIHNLTLGYTASSRRNQCLIVVFMARLMGMIQNKKEWFNKQSTERALGGVSKFKKRECSFAVSKNPAVISKQDPEGFTKPKNKIKIYLNGHFQKWKKKGKMEGGHEKET